MKQIISAVLIAAATGASALPDNANVPILLYHSWNVREPCNEYLANDVEALAKDLEMIHAEGFAIVPLIDIVHWRLGWLPGSALPDRVVGISLDDGYDLDYLGQHDRGMPCRPQRSAREVLEHFKWKHNAPVHATLFVIGSREARRNIEPRFMGDNWWGEADAHPLLSIKNHTSDHESDAIKHKHHDDYMDAYVPAAGYADGIWEGQNNPARINNLESNRVFIRDSAEYIWSKTGSWPDLLAYPLGISSDYTRTNYLPNNVPEHGTAAAFCTTATYLTKQSPRWCLPRYSFGWDWKSPAELKAILDGAK